MNGFGFWVTLRMHFVLPLFLLPVFLIDGQEFGPHRYQGPSFLQTRPVLMRQSMSNHVWIEHIYTKKGLCGSGFSMTPFFFRVKDQHHAHSYFLPSKKHAILVAGDTNDQKTVLQRDVRAEWLGLPSNTNVLYGLCPSYRQSGFILSYNQDVKKIISCDFLSHWQIGIRLPFVLVENTLCPGQNPVASDVVPSVINAFNNNTWCAQRIVPHRRSTGIGDINVYLDSPYFVKDFFIFAAHSGFTIPTAPKSCQTYLFAPVRGNGHRFALFGGVDMQIRLNQNAHVWQTAFFVSLESYYHFHTHARRTFDIHGKPWSRFLLFNRSDDPIHTNIPGVNVLTFNAHIRPQTYGELSCGWRFRSATWHIEFGYNLWGHDSERIKYIDEDLLPVFGIAGSTSLRSANSSTIVKKAADDATFIAIKIDDLDLRSAASASALNHGIHLAVGASKVGKTVDAFMGCGLFVERGHRPGTLPQWGGWFKIGFTV
jgi:hypothetical protein